MYADGISINTTAAMHQPYALDLGYGLPTPNFGLSYFNPVRLTRLVTELDTAGFRINIHAIGDRGITESLNAIEQAQLAIRGKTPQKRHLLTHVEFSAPRDFARFRLLNVTADIQVAGRWTMPGHHSEFETSLLGAERMNRQMPLASLHSAGARITLSSDWDVSDLNPFAGMQHALTRGVQSLPTLHDVIKAYTLNAAYALAQDDKVGSLKVGKIADLTIVDRNLFAIPTEDIGGTQVLYTLVDGDVVYQRKRETH